jgi:hypothetical protein
VSFDPAASPTEPVARVRDIVQVRLRPAALLVPAALPIPEHATRPLP